MRLIKTTAMFAACALLLSGCLKSKSINFAKMDSPSPNTVDFNNQTETAALDIVATPTIYTFYAELNSSNKSYPATTVTIAKNAAAVTAAGQEFLPDSAFQLLNITATPDPATHLAAFQLKIFTTKIDLAHNFAVAYTITSATGGAVIASNKTDDLITVSAKNKYDGHYSVTATAPFVDYSNAAFTGRYPLDVDLLTVNGTTVYMIDNAIGIPSHSFLNNGGLSYYGSFGPVFTFNTATDALTTVVNYYGQPSGNGRYANINPAGLNKWNSADRSIDVKYWMDQPTVITPHRVAFSEHFTYLGPR
ncbi:MAG: hypothetical protein Q8941_17540 [Bacteroidota bacterium]|nr:hypothetical protein [Bacteroidota bacterium]